jgi:hypothetical protein
MKTCNARGVKMMAYVGTETIDYIYRGGRFIINVEFRFVNSCRPRTQYDRIENVQCQRIKTMACVSTVTIVHTINGKDVELGFPGSCEFRDV